MMGGRIMIVDDETSMCQMLETDLRLREFETSAFTSAEEAFAALKAGEFDVVLTDLKMPGLSGVALIRRIRELDPGAVCIGDPICH